MQSHSRHPDHDRYKNRISNLFKSYDDIDIDPEVQTHNAKYIAVLISGYLEQAIKELLLHYTSQRSDPKVSRYIKETWPSSKNMNVKNIEDILRQFNSKWAVEFDEWLHEKDTRKGDINEIVRWRNNIAHGQESKTTNVTLPSVKAKFATAGELVLLITEMVE